MLFGRTLIAMQRKGGERLRTKFAGKKVRIWSCEHMAWWRPDRAGYCIKMEDSGVYSFEDAWDATHHCGPEKRIIFYLVDKECAP